MSLLGAQPGDPTTAVRRAFLAEAIFHISTIPLLTHPRQYMSLFILQPSDITNFTAFLIRVFACIILFGMTPALLHGLPKTEWAISSRRATYILLAGTEIFLIPFLLVELSKGGDVNEGAVLSVKVTLALLTALVTPFSFRLYALFVKPEMMGKYRGKVE